MASIGNIISYVSPFSLTCRTLGDGYCEMTITLKIDAEILKYSFVLHYKYTVFSPKAEEDDDCYEYLHDYQGYTNRCLVIPVEKYSQIVHHGGSLSHCIYC